jgi:protein-disulfide isomerase-like protein with CxxC motif
VSWCWGFAPVIAGVAERHADAARVTLALGSLGRGDRPMRP